MEFISILAWMVTIAIESQLSDAVKSLVLTSEPSLPSCREPVLFTCRASEIVPILRWKSNDTIIFEYQYDNEMQSFPQDVDPVLRGSYPGVVVEVVAAFLSADNALNINSTLCVSNLSLLNGLPIHCEDRFGDQSNMLLETAPSPFNTSDCSLVSFLGNSLNVSLRWSPPFNLQYNVERYRVTVIPDPSPSCSGVVPPSEDYSCSGLDPETDYSITISAINCGGQEGESAIFVVQPQLLAPKAPQAIEVMPDSLEWMEYISQEEEEEEEDSLTASGKCSFTGAINYTLILMDSTGRAEERNVSSDSCVNGSCSTTLSPSSQICSVNIVASNAFGSSNTTSISIDPPGLTSTNQVLLGLGVVLLCVAIAGACVVFIVMNVKSIRVFKLSVILLVCGAVLMLVSVVLWVVVGVQVGLQNNTCDSDWQTSRDGLIISSFVFSMMSLILVVVAAVFVVSNAVKNKNKGNVKVTKSEKPGSGKYFDDFKVNRENFQMALARIDPVEKAKTNNDVIDETKIDDPVQYDVTQHNIPPVKVPPRDSTYSPLEPAEKEKYAVLKYIKDRVVEPVTGDSEYGKLGLAGSEEHAESAVKQSGVPQVML